MVTATQLSGGAVAAVDYRCDAGPGEAPYPEWHGVFSLSYVRKGSFGYAAQGRNAEMVAGSILVGHAGDEFMCTHDHHVCGDECLSFQLAPELAEAISGHRALRRLTNLPPLPEMMVMGELAQAAAEGRSDVGLERRGVGGRSTGAETGSGKDWKLSR